MRRSTSNRINMMPVFVLFTLVYGSMILSIAAYANQWQPEASETLIKLPANVIEKRVEQNFKASPMARRLADLDSQMSDKTTRIANLQQDMKNASSDAIEDIEYELVQQKSDYLDLLQESHTLRKQAATQKQAVYQDILQQYRQQDGANADSERLVIEQKQQQALLRMEKVMAQVDQNLMHKGVGESSPYADEYATNVAQIEKLKNAIAKHKANASPTLNGSEVSSQEYLRQLLLDASMHQSLLDQEGLMLSYMARLVALDAQALEYKIAYGESEDGQSSQVNKASPAVDLFVM